MFRTVCLVLACAALAASVTIESTFLNTFIANGTQGNETQWQQRTLTISCSNTAFRDPNLLIGNLSYDIFCQPPSYVFQTVLRQFVPYTLRRFTAEYCEVDTMANINPNVSSTSAPPPSRRLLSSRRLLDALTDCLNTVGNSKEALVNCANTVGSVSGCSSSDPHDNTGSPLGGCPPWLQPSGGCSSVTDCLPTYLKGNADALTQIATWVSGQQIINQGQLKTITDLTNITEIQLERLRIQEDEAVQLNLSISALALSTSETYDDISDQLTNLTRQLQSQLVFDQSVSIREQQFENTTQQNFGNFSAAAQQLASNISANFYTMIGQNRGAVQLLRTLAGLFSKSYARIGTRRGLTRQIWQFIAQAQSQGLTPFLDPAAGGSPPGTASTASQTVALDTLYINMINETTPTVHQFKLSYFCNVGTVINDFLGDATFSDLLDQVGPPGCTQLPGSTVSNCGCWLQINHSTCFANGAREGRTQSFDWQQITSRTDISAYILQNNPTYCSGTGDASNRITNGPWDGRLIDDIRVFNDFIGRLCTSASTLSGSPPGQTAPRQQQLVSTRIGVLNLDPPSNPALTCKPNYDYIFQVNPVPENNVVFAVFIMWIQSQTLLLSDQYTYETQVQGVLPNFLTFEEIPFKLLSNQKTYTCHRASFVAIGPDTRPVFEVIPANIDTFVQVNAYATEPVCDNTGCIFGTPVSTQTSVSAVTDVPFSFLLPDGSNTIVGEWRTHGNPTMTTIFDVPSGGAPVDNVQSNRKGKVTYTWQQIPDGYNISTQTSFSESLPAPLGPWPHTTLMDKWNPLNPISFNAVDAQFSLDLTETAFVNGHCQSDNSIVPEWACNMFNHFSIGALTDMRKGLLVLKPTEWSYIVTLDIVEGEILQRVFPGCPEIAYTSFTTGFQQVTLTNSLPNPITVVLRTVNLSPDTCPSVGDQTFAMLPKQTQTSFLVPCGHQLITVFQRSTATGQLVLCSDALNITFDPLSQANVAMFTSATTNRSIVDDAIQAQVSALQIQALDFLNSIVPLLVLDFSPTLTAPERADALNALFDAQNKSLQALFGAASTVNTQSALEAIAPFVASFNALNAKQDALDAQEVALEAKLHDDVGGLQGDVKRQAQTTNNTIAAITNDVDITKDYINALTSAQSATGQCNWCGGSILNNAPGLCAILCSVITFLIGIVPFLLIGVAVYLAYKFYTNRKQGNSGGGSGKVVVELSQKAPVPAATNQVVQGRYSRERASERDQADLAPLLRVP